MKAYGMTDTGMYRPDNQDYYASCALVPPPRVKGARIRDTEAFLAVVCDGMGGAKGGAVASALAAETFVETMRSTRAKDAQSAMMQALAAANRAVYGEATAKETLQGMGTTLACALAYSDRLALMHVGDSRIYLWHQGHLLLLTHDHSYVQQLVDAGRMTAEEARHSRYKNIIMRAVGTAAEVEGDFAYCLWEEGDKVLLCTDGLTGFVEESEISGILSEDVPGEIVVRELIGAANSRGCDDNLTAFLLENTKEKE